MEIQLTPAQEDFVRLGIESGRCTSADEAVKTALLRRENEQRSLLELIASIRMGEIDLENGNYREYDATSSPSLLDELRQEIGIQRNPSVQ